MKIDTKEKELFEAKLFEEPESVDGALDASDSVGDLAADVADSVKASTGGEVALDGAAAEKIATEIKDVAGETGIDIAAVDTPDVGPLGVENAVTKVLDMALTKSRQGKRRGTKSGYNVLIVGLPGSGKTASILDWASAKGVNLVMVNAKNNDLDAYINGYTTKDPDNPRKVTQAFSDNLAGLEKENSVLFLDEYNRQVKPHIRASLYTLINEHKIVGDGPDGMHEFKNLLFTIAAINPSVPTDKGAAELSDAEKSRFWWTIDDLDSDPASTIEYLTKYYTKLINKLNKDDEYYREDLEAYLRILDLGIFVLSHPKFAYDTRDDLDDLALSKTVLLCQRALTNGLHNSDGDVAEFKRWVERGSKFLDRDIEMLLDILKEYINPTFEDLCAGHGLDVSATGVASTADDTSIDDTAADAASEDAGLEDDDDFFVSSSLAGKVRAKNPYEVEVAIASVIKDW